MGTSAVKTGSLGQATDSGAVTLVRQCRAVDTTAGPGRRDSGRECRTREDCATGSLRLTRHRGEAVIESGRRAR
ncbi:hypothetical protein BJY54_003458 [Streptomyces nodosus]|nr:hypothetical protein [Streptomyces nodosus]